MVAGEASGQRAQVEGGGEMESQRRVRKRESRQRTIVEGNVQALEILLVMVQAGVVAGLQATHLHSLVLTLRIIGFVAAILLALVAIRSLLRPPRFGIIHWAYIVVSVFAVAYYVGVG